MRFLVPEVFHAQAFSLIWQMTETARLKRPSRRSRQALDSLWPLILGKSQVSQPEPKRPIPLILNLWLLAQYFQVWGCFDGWRAWLSSRYTSAQVLQELPLLIPILPGLKPTTRQALLVFAMEWLGHEEAPEAHLEHLGLLTEAAQTLHLQTQSELLLEEMALLLPQQLESERPRLAFELGMQWLRHGWGRQARFALQAWQSGFARLEWDDQQWEVQHCLSHFELYWADLSPLPLEQTSLLHSWLLRLAEWVLRQEEETSLFVRALRLALAWGLPEGELWWQTQIADALNEPEHLQASFYGPFYRPLLLGYARALDSITQAQRLLSILPLEPLRVEPAVLQGLYRASWYAEDLDDDAQIRLLHLQTLNHLFKHSKGKRRHKLRRQIFAAGAVLLDDLRAPALKQIRSELLAVLRLSPKLVKSPSDWAHQSLKQQLLSAQQLGDRWALAQDLLYQGGGYLRDWISGILAYPPADLAGSPPKQTELRFCLAIYASLPAGWERWQMGLGLAKGLLAHWPWEQVRPYWGACFDWSELEGYEPLQAFSGLALALSHSTLPDKAGWFEKLAGCIAEIDPDWQSDTWIAVGHCQIRAGLLAEGLQTLAQIPDPEMALQGLLQVGSVLTEIKQNDRYPDLIRAILACVDRQRTSELKWNGYLAAASALALRGKSAEGQAHFQAGLDLFLP